MAITVKHKFECLVPDDLDTALVRPSNWNDEHDLTGLGTAAEADVSDFVSSIAACASITTTNITNWNSAFSWGNHSAAGYVQIVSGTLPLGTATGPMGLPYNELITLQANTAGSSGRTALVLQNTNSSSGSIVSVATDDISKRLNFGVTNSAYTIPYFAVIGSNGGLPFYLITDGELTSGGTSNVTFRLGGYTSAADAFIFDYQKRLGIGVTNPTFDISFSGNDAKTIWMERNTVSNTGGNTLSVFAGGATVGATNKNGGDLLLRSGSSTGTGESGVKIQTAVAGASGTSNRFSTNVMFQALGNKLAFNGATPVTKPTVTGSRGGNAALASLLTALDTLGLITDSTTA